MSPAPCGPSSGAPQSAFRPSTWLLGKEPSPDEIVALTLAVVAINGWNRFAVGLRTSSTVSHGGLDRRLSVSG
jgi:alkylhydroperoxidase family enzyme